jgi:hypothetical protein
VQRSTEILILLLIPNSNTLMLSVVRNVFVPLDHDALHYAEGAQFLCFKSSPSRALSSSLNGGCFAAVSNSLDDFAIRYGAAE